MIAHPIRRRRPELLAVLLLGSLGFSGPASAGSAEEANGVIDRWAAAFTANDVETLLKLYSPRAILLGTVSPIIAEGSEPIRAYFSRLRNSGSKVVLGDRRTMVLGDGAALGAGFYEFTQIRGGEPVKTTARFSMVVVREGEEWVIAHHHSSAVPSPPP